MVANADNPEQRRTIKRSWTLSNPVWNPSGNGLVALARVDGDKDFPVIPHFIPIHQEGSLGEPMPLDGLAYLWESPPVPSPDGEFVAFTEGWPISSLMVVGIDGSSLTELDTETSFPAWLPGDNRITYAKNDTAGADGAESVISFYSIRPDGSDRQEMFSLPGDIFGDEYPAWSPDASAMIFSGHITARDGSMLGYVPSPYSYSWSPDGTKIAVVNDDGELLIFAADGSQERRIAGVYD